MGQSSWKHLSALGQQGKRGRGHFGSQSDRENTLNQMLVEGWMARQLDMEALRGRHRSCSPARRRPCRTVAHHEAGCAVIVQFGMSEKPDHVSFDLPRQGEMLVEKRLVRPPPSSLRRRCGACRLRL
ncbi:Hypothetical predicted protein [Lynx pardinus]|uniref:Uncharacterized protein n=1 Tax=Lynx pardinus TaxID=191816 RepID=A0A485P178_LYNPA|nr:Hypothetical predicted protein [Lynx pardinus]